MPGWSYSISCEGQCSLWIFETLVSEPFLKLSQQPNP